MQRRCLRQKTNKKDPILILIKPEIGSLFIYVHIAFSENSDVSTTELDRKPWLQLGLQWTYVMLSYP